jgi:hypothetical protein
MLEVLEAARRAPLLGRHFKAPAQEPFPYRSLSLIRYDLRSLLAVKGSLRRAQQRRALDRLRAVLNKPSYQEGKAPIERLETSHRHRRQNGTLFRRNRHNEAERVGKEAHRKSGKDLPVGLPQRVFARQQVFALRVQGQSYRQIACCLGIGEETVRRVVSSQ